MKQATYTRDFAHAAGEDDGTVLPRFYMEAEEYELPGHNGMKAWRDIEMVEVIMPGNANSKPTFAVTDVHRTRWPRQYAAFKANQEMPLNGTPLEEWAILKKSQVLTLKSLEFRTVEDVALMSEIAIQRIGMGGRELKRKAEAFLDESKAAAIVNAALEKETRDAATIAELRGQIETLNQQFATLSQQALQSAENQRFAMQNVASTPQAVMQQVSEPVPQEFAGAFATFAAPSHKDELAKFNAAKGPKEPTQPEKTTITIQPGPRRGRPTNAEIAARKVTEAAHG